MIDSHGSHRVINARQDARRGYAHNGMEVNGRRTSPQFPVARQCDHFLWRLWQPGQLQPTQSLK